MAKALGGSGDVGKTNPEVFFHNTRQFNQVQLLIAFIFNRNYLQPAMVPVSNPL